MNNIYETMWNDHKRWMENALTYYTSLLDSYHPDVNPDFHRIANLQGMYTFLVDKLNQDELINAEQIKSYEEENEFGK